MTFHVEQCNVVDHPPALTPSQQVTAEEVSPYAAAIARQPLTLGEFAEPPPHCPVVSGEVEHGTATVAESRRSLGRLPRLECAIPYRHSTGIQPLRLRSSTQLPLVTVRGSLRDIRAMRLMVSPNVPTAAPADEPM